MTEDDVLASLEQMKKDAPRTAPKEGSMAAMASDATKSVAFGDEQGAEQRPVRGL